MESIYRIFVCGQTERFGISLMSAISRDLLEFGLTIGHEVALDKASAIKARGAHISTVALFMGSEPTPSFNLGSVLSPHHPIIPLVSSLDKCGAELPSDVSAYNAMATSGPNAENAISSAVLECLGLLPARRRIFLSYRRAEARNVALQLFDALSGRQFDIFLDTHEIRPGALFQDVLWHNLSDCDVLLMLDTKTYFESRWTKEEFGAANLKKCAILRVGYPGFDRDETLSVTSSVELLSGDFQSDGLLRNGAIDRIADSLERLRSKSVSARQANLIGTLRAAVTQLGGTLEKPGQLRRVLATFPCGKTIRVYPVVGVPTSELVNKVVVDSGTHECALLYDRLGVLSSWQDHLEWLGEHIDHFRWIKADNAKEELKEAL